MLFGDQPYPDNQPLSLRGKIIRAVVRAYQKDLPGIPIEDQVKIAVASVLGAAGLTGAAGKALYDWGVSLRNTEGPVQVTPEKRTRAPSIEPVNPDKKKMRFEENDIEMDQEAEVPVLAAARTENAATIGGGETQITPQKPWYGLPETATVVLPFTTYFTAVTNSNQNMFNFYFRLNSPVDCLITTVSTPTAGGGLGVGLYNKKPGSGNSWPNPAQAYPTEISSSGPQNTEYPHWRGYWERVYNKYTVLGCEYELTFRNPVTSLMHDVTICTGVESLSTQNGGRVFPTNVPVATAEFWPGLKWKVCRSYNDGTTDATYTVIKGQYKPGTVKTNVQNDEDIKTWTTVASTPTLTERMMVGIAQSAFNSDTGNRAVQVKLKLKYIVQYKDISVNALYPASGQTPIAQNIPTDILTAV